MPGKKLNLKLIAGPLVLAATLAAPQAAAAIEVVEATPAQASVQIDEAEQALAGTPGLDPTSELIDVATILPSLDGAERRRAKALLARPPFDEGGRGEPFGGGWSEEASMTEQKYATPGGQFLIHWVKIGGDAPSPTDTPANGIPDYVELVAESMDESKSVENDALGWPTPKSDGTRGGDSRTDVYLSDICSESGQGCVFGYAGPDDHSSQCNRPPYRCFAYLVLDNDYSSDEFGYPDPEIPLQVTAAHEYNHILQFKLDALQDQWLFESTAVWMEEQVFPLANDWLTYMGPWSRGSERSLTSARSSQGIRIYGSAVWHHWLVSGAGYGPGVVLDAWERSRQGSPKDFAAGAYDRAIRVHGPHSFSKEFVRFAAATTEWRTGAGNFPDAESIDDVRRRGILRTGRARRTRLDHAAYRLLRVDPPAKGAIRLLARVPRGVRAGVALVGRTGSATLGKVTTRLRNLRPGRTTGVRLRRASSFDRVTAVLINADGRARTYSEGRADWVYPSDNARFRFRLKR